MSKKINTVHQRKKKSLESNGCKDLASKKEHVRELAKARRWKQIKKEYGDKMVVRAKHYLEKIISKQTPAYLAMKILEQNGYGAVNASKASVDIEKSANNMISKVLTDKSDAVGYVEATAEKSVTMSESKLTKEQIDQIEEKRKEALARRKKLAEQSKSVPANISSETPKKTPIVNTISLEQDIQAATEIFQSDISDHSGDLICRNILS
ncbi:hypothetical protein ABG067_002559 [Albugo candida]